jgi:hypothetical protein
MRAPSSGRPCTVSRHDWVRRQRYRGSTTYNNNVYETHPPPICRHPMDRPAGGTVRIHFCGRFDAYVAWLPRHVTAARATCVEYCPFCFQNHLSDTHYSGFHACVSTGRIAVYCYLCRGSNVSKSSSDRSSADLQVMMHVLCLRA